ncbi:HU family DNA-binding protein [Psychrobacter sp. T6-1]|uniref:HU family DNA-binding protein n=1 Tax=Psychrobacter sp. T6-1 TaxID=3457447 RepID=UPI003FCFFB91
MNKQDLVAVMADNADLTKAQAARALDAFEYAVGATLQDGGTIKLVGFGTFKTRARAAYVGKNPATGEPVNVPESRRVNFTAGKDLKELVNLN